MNHAELLYFSATGSTERIAGHMASLLAENIKKHDLSIVPAEDTYLSKNSIAIVAIPVYAGRIPSPAKNALYKFHGNGIKTISIAVYGNRNFDDALLELNDQLEEQNFNVIASGGFIAEHSLVREIAAGRPDQKDFESMKEFADKVADKISSGRDKLQQTVPGSRPYKESPPVKCPILVSQQCTGCGLCAKKCPVDAINFEKPSETDSEKCIVCMRCASVCPVKARSLPTPVYEKFSAFLKESCPERRENEMFL